MSTYKSLLPFSKLSLDAKLQKMRQYVHLTKDLTTNLRSLDNEMTSPSGKSERMKY